MIIQYDKERSGYALRKQDGTIFRLIAYFPTYVEANERRLEEERQDGYIELPSVSSNKSRYQHRSPKWFQEESKKQVRKLSKEYSKGDKRVGAYSPVAITRLESS